MKTPKTFGETIVLTDAEREMLGLGADVKGVVPAEIAEDLEIQLAATHKTLDELKTVVAERIAANLNNEWQRDAARLNWMADSYAAAGMDATEAEAEARAYEKAYAQAKRHGMADRLAVRVAVDAALALQKETT